jgi:hypothetical protein
MVWGRLDPGMGDVGEADQPDLAGRLELGHGAHRLEERDLGVGTVELVQADGVDPEGAQAGLARLAQVLGAPVEAPLAALAGWPPLGGATSTRSRSPGQTSRAFLTRHSPWPTSEPSRQSASAVSIRVTPASGRRGWCGWSGELHPPLIW